MWRFWWFRLSNWEYIAVNNVLEIVWRFRLYNFYFSIQSVCLWFLTSVFHNSTVQIIFPSRYK